jgi:hypothetical protein
MKAKSNEVDARSWPVADDMTRHMTSAARPCLQDAMPGNGIERQCRKWFRGLDRRGVFAFGERRRVHGSWTRSHLGNAGRTVREGAR